MSYFKNIFTTGAISRTPERVLKRIVEEVPVFVPDLIIELGAGKGEITINVNNKIKAPPPRYIAFEIHKDFADKLKLRFPGITVLEEDALNFDQFTNGKADLILCSIPLSFFSKQDRKVLLEKIKTNIKNGGKAIILFHAFWLLPEFKEVFPSYKLIKIFNIPPYYIITYSSQKT